MFFLLLFLEPVGSFPRDCRVFRAPRPPEVKPKDKARRGEARRLDRCQSIDLQVPAAPLEDATLHKGGIDGHAASVT